MTRRGALAAATAALVLATAVGVARRDLAAQEPPAGSEPLLYLPNGKHLKAISLGHASLVADVLYVWAIQYYSNYDRADRYRYVEHVFGDVIAELDPHYTDPYWLGALILSLEAHDLDGGLRLLEKGFRKNPDAWVLMYLAGWEAESAGRHEEAAAYFERGARVPGAPEQMKRLYAGMIARGGDLREAARAWAALLDDPNADAATRAIAERQVRELTVRADVADLETAVAVYRERHGTNPRSLDALVSAGILRFLPADPDGNRYAYEPRTGKVGSAAGRILGDRG